MLKEVEINFLPADHASVVNYKTSTATETPVVSEYSAVYHAESNKELVCSSSPLPSIGGGPSASCPSFSTPLEERCTPLNAYIPPLPYDVPSSDDIHSNSTTTTDTLLSSRKDLSPLQPVEEVVQSQIYDEAVSPIYTSLTSMPLSGTADNDTGSQVSQCVSKEPVTTPQPVSQIDDRTSLSIQPPKCSSSEPLTSLLPVQQSLDVYLTKSRTLSPSKSLEESSPSEGKVCNIPALSEKVYTEIINKLDEIKQQGLRTYDILKKINIEATDASSDGASQQELESDMAKKLQNAKCITDYLNLNLLQEIKYNEGGKQMLKISCVFCQEYIKKIDYSYAKPSITINRSRYR